MLLRLSDLWGTGWIVRRPLCPPRSLSLKVTPRLISPEGECGFARFAAPFDSLAAFKRTLRHAVGLSISGRRRVEIQQSVNKTPRESALNPLF